MLGLCLYASKSTDSVPHGDEVARLGHIRILFGSYFYREIYLGRVVKSKMGASLTTTLTRGGRRVWRVWRMKKYSMTRTGGLVTPFFFVFRDLPERKLGLRAVGRSV